MLALIDIGFYIYEYKHCFIILSSFVRCMRGYFFFPIDLVIGPHLKPQRVTLLRIGKFYYPLSFLQGILCQTDAYELFTFFLHIQIKITAYR